MSTFQTFGILIDGKNLRVSRYLGPLGTLYTARLEGRVLAIFVSDGNWRTYGGTDKNNNIFKCAIMEWNAVAHDGRAKLDPSYNHLII